MKLPVALQLYSVRDMMEKDFEGTLKAVKVLGYDGVEFAGLFGKSASEVKALCEKYELVPISAHVPYFDMLENPEAVLSVYKEIGCKYVAVPYLTEECRPGTDGWASTVEGVRKIGEAAKKLGIKLLYHNHDFEFVKVDGEYALDMLYKAVSEDLLATELDTCWVNVGGEEPASFVLKYSGRAPIVHLKDFVGEKGNGAVYRLIGIDSDEAETKSTFEFRPVGYGKQDWYSIIAASEKAGAEWVVVEQDDPSMEKSTIDCAKLSINYVRTLRTL